MGFFNNYINNNPFLITSNNAFYPLTKFNATNDYYILGLDKTDKVLWVRNYSNGQLLQSSDYQNGFTSFSTNKTWPTTVNGVSKTFNSSVYAFMSRWKDKVVLVGQTTDTASNVKVWYTSPSSGNNTFSWTWSKTLTDTTGQSPIPKTAPDGNDTYLFVGEYGEPSGGASIWRTSDLSTWEKCYTNASVKHIHDVKCDPYRTNWVWASCGDDASPANLLLSKDNGTNWTIVSYNPSFQGVQISFDPNYVYIGGDSSYSYATVMVVDREELAVRIGSKNNTKNYPVPNSKDWTSGYTQSSTSPATDLTSVADLKMRISVDGDRVQNSITLAQSGTGADIASDIQTKIRALGTINGVDYSGVTCSYTGGRYVITSATKGDNSWVRVYPGAQDVTWRLKIGVGVNDQSTNTVDGISDRFTDYAYYGCVDPDTGIYYCVSVEGTLAYQKHGLFYLPKVGESLILLETFKNNYNPGQALYILEGYLYFGQYRRKLLLKA